MFLKIRLRSALLKCWEPTRFRNYSHPLSAYVYYDAVNAWMPVIKLMKKDGASIDEIVPEFIDKVMDGICPDKYHKAVTSSGNETYKIQDLIDQDLLSHIDTLTDGDDGLKNMMRGSGYSLKY